MADWCKIVEWDPKTTFGFILGLIGTGVATIIGHAIGWWRARPNFAVKSCGIKPILRDTIGTSSFLTGTVNICNRSTKAGSFTVSLAANGQCYQPRRFIIKCPDMPRSNEYEVHVAIDGRFQGPYSLNYLNLGEQSIDSFSRQPLIVALNAPLSGQVVFYLGVQVSKIQNGSIIVKHIESGQTRTCPIPDVSEQQ